MGTPLSARQQKVIFVAQLISLIMIWIFVTGIALWIINLLMLSIELNDALEATIGISIVAIPVFYTLAGILTYVFVGLKKEERRISDASPET